MPTLRNLAYRARKNYKKALKRRERRQRQAMLPLFVPEAPFLIAGGVLDPGEAAGLFMGTARLQQIRKSVRGFSFSNPCQDFHPAHLPRLELLNAPQLAGELRRPCRRVEFFQATSEIMVKNLKPLFYKPFCQPFSGTVAGYHQCPRCMQGETLRIFPAPASGDVYFRCHRCGSTLSTLEQFQASDRLGNDPWDVSAKRAYDFGIVASPYTDEAVTTTRRLHQWRNALVRGREYYASLVRAGEISACFGDWAAFDRRALVRLMEDVQLPVRETRQLQLVQVSRNAFGFPTLISIYSTDYVPLRELRFSPEHFLFDAPRWPDFLDWSSNVIVCSDREMATAVERAVSAWSPQDRIAVVGIAEAAEPVTSYAPPFQNIWLPIRHGKSAEAGLPFGDAAAHVRVVRVDVPDGPEVMKLDRRQLCHAQTQGSVDVVARDLANDGRSLPALLSSTLANPAITGAVGRKLTETAAALKGESIGQVEAGVDVQSSPYAVRLGSGTYLCRNGVYLKRKKAGGAFGPISNFSVRIERTEPHRRDNPQLELKLVVNGGAAYLKVSAALFQNSVRLWKSLRAAAAAAGLATPLFFTVPDRRLLPEIIRGTHQP